MGLRDLLKKKESLEDAGSAAAHAEAARRLAPPAPPEFTFIRSDTHSQEVIHPPSDPASLHDSEGNSNSNYLTARDNGGGGASLARRSLDVFKPRSRSTSVSSKASSSGFEKRRLSQRLHLSRAPSSSENVPQDLPEILPGGGGGDGSARGGGGGGGGAGEEAAQWENRATMLARENEKRRSRPPTPTRELSALRLGEGEHTTPQNGVVSSQAIDADIQEAIRLHEGGQLEQSTRLFGQLADPRGANNPLSQVLYGLALRHGWGCTPDPAGAVNYLSAAASNAATVETLALQAGLKKGGAAKGELVLAIFELANCFRHGWGIPRDPIAAKQYYETAANLGDSDAMNEVAWCYLEGFGCKKDKFAAAKYYRLAEESGSKTLGNSWIWKDKYNAGNSKK